jgi:hypothetical protein
MKASLYWKNHLKKLQKGEIVLIDLKMATQEISSQILHNRITEENDKKNKTRRRKKTNIFHYILKTKEKPLLKNYQGKK